MIINATHFDGRTGKGTVDSCFLDSAWRSYNEGERVATEIIFEGKSTGQWSQITSMYPGSDVVSFASSPHIRAPEPKTFGEGTVTFLESIWRKIHPSP